MIAVSNNILGIKRLNYEQEIESLVIKLYFILLSFTTVMSVFDQIPMYSGTFTTLASTGIFPIFKFIKDILVVVLLFAMLPLFLYRSKTPLFITTLLFFLFVIISAAYTLFTTKEIYFLAGFRWILPVFIILFLGVIDLKKFEKLAVYLISYIFFINVLTQIYQLAFMPHWFGTTEFGMSSRVIGIFMAPNTSAFFTCTAIAFLTYKKDYFSRTTIVAMLLFGMLSIFLTRSGTGLITLVALLVILFVPMRYLILALLSLVIVLPIIFLNLDGLLNRENYVALSGFGRLNLMMMAFKNVGFLSGEFGYNTNTANLLFTMLDPAKVYEAADSIIASVQGNLGYLGSIMYLGVVIYFAYKALVNKNSARLSIIAVYVIFGMTTVTFEVFPMIYLLPIIYGNSRAMDL
ncbi:hypothetical protein [Vibrio fluvialis]|uniref:hypothetical protein n=1 Tax=Vibrio fluvialis TaxID=676 RepID=UPI000CEB3DF5|nr:hypothetical protein [Vibrio fluvialis]AVH31561.1 hypothetical protein AL475_06645 [Vibrio fluvialis]TOY91702.1 hypothetical protein DJ016_19215 [Vibrio fluvialis]TRN09761.1 hypothetical protein DM587_17640 [Vibrio fluvialis]